ncbi:MAG: ATP-dependent Clp protease proteolytic subunit [Myxococcaceae bacterium]|nr:ATP-dependent Clp protease proteolytic subunit [Myxococcaceae bacterium]
MSRPFDKNGALLRRRMIHLEGELDDEVATVVVAQLLYLESVDAEKEIELHINSLGGSVISMLAIRDTIRGVQPLVSTICRGQAVGAAAILLASGARGRRVASAHSRVCLMPLVGEATTPEQVKELQRLTEQNVQLLVSATGQTRAQVVADLDRGRAFTAEEALAYGLVDLVA